MGEINQAEVSARNTSAITDISNAGSHSGLGMGVGHN